MPQTTRHHRACAPQHTLLPHPQVFLGKEGTFRGTVLRFDPSRQRFKWLMRYDGGEEEWGCVTEDRAGWRVQGGVRPAAWLGRVPPPVDAISLAAGAADGVAPPPPPPAPKKAPAPAEVSSGVIANIMGAEMEVRSGGRAGGCGWRAGGRAGGRVGGRAGRREGVDGGAAGMVRRQRAQPRSWGMRPSGVRAWKWGTITAG